MGLRSNLYECWSLVTDGAIVRVLITGATGYIGRKPIVVLIRSGHEVIVASRTRPERLQHNWVFFDLGNASTFTLPLNIDCVIHLAARTTHSNLKASTEILAAKCLLGAALTAQAKFVFVSSQVARADAPTEYGRTKYEIEQLVFKSHGYVVRPGQVYGGEERGLFGVLVNAVKKLPMIPAFLPAPRIQPIHIDDLALCLTKLIESKVDLPHMLCLGSPVAVSFTTFLNLIGLQRFNRNKPSLPIPRGIVTLCVKLLGKKLSSKLGVDKLISLFNVPAMSTAEDLRSLGITLRPLRAGLTRSGQNQRRELIREACALLRYVLNAQCAQASTIRRYVRAIEHLRESHTAELRPFILAYPAYLTLLDWRCNSNNKFASELAWRINMATVVAEASPHTAELFIGSDLFDNKLNNGTRIISSLCKECFWLVLRFLTKPFIEITSFQSAGRYDA